MLPQFLQQNILLKNFKCQKISVKWRRKLEHIGELEYDDEGLFQQLKEINQPPDNVVNALQNNEYSTDSKTITGLIPTEQPAIFHLVQEKGLIFNDELRFLSSAQPPV